MRRLAAVLLAGALVGLAAAQPPVPKEPPAKPADKKMDVVPKTDPAPKARAGKTVEVEDKSFKSADGVKLVGKFYKSSKSNASAVILLHAYGANPAEGVWEDMAQSLAADQGYSVLRFDFRGHGGSTEVIPGEFWTNPVNRAMVSGGGANVAAKNTIKFKDFKSNYFPMLVQDIAAARNVLDQMNDTGEVNTSTIYLVGAGDAVNLGLFYIASEYLRERQKPNIGIPAQYVSPRRGLFPTSEPAGPDFGGAVWLSPARHPSVSNEFLKSISLNNYAINMRTETPMLFVSGAKDAKSGAVAKSLFNDVLAVNATANPLNSGMKIPKQMYSYIKTIDSSAAIGTKLLGNNLGTEKMIEEFLTAMEKDRKSKTRKNRDWDKPLIIDVNAFGAIR